MQDLERRIQRLEDIEAIRQLKARYFHACDRKDVETLRQCFAEGEIHIDYGVIGRFNDREAFLSVYKEKACHSHIVDMHHGQNAQIHWLSEQEATAIWDLFFHQIDTETNTITQLAGFYKDRFIKQSGKWVIIDTCFTITSTYITTLSDGIPKALHAGLAPMA